VDVGVSLGVAVAVGVSLGVAVGGRVDVEVGRMGVGVAVACGATLEVAVGLPPEPSSPPPQPASAIVRERMIVVVAHRPLPRIPSPPRKYGSWVRFARQASASDG
jgi:hypothetical protein